MRYLIIVAGLLLTSLQPSLAADTCVGSPVDKAVCGNPNLKKMDAEVLRILAELIIKTNEVDIINASQEGWIERRDKACGGTNPVPCLTTQYRARLVELREALKVVGDDFPKTPPARMAAPQRAFRIENGSFKCHERIVGTGFDRCTLQTFMHITVPNEGSFIASGTCIISYRYSTAKSSYETRDTEVDYFTISGYGPTHMEDHYYSFMPGNLAFDEVIQVRLTDATCTIESIR